MPPTVPTIEPDVLYAGATAKWTRSFSDYSAVDGWVLTYSFRGPVRLDDVQATTNGSGFAVTIGSSITAKLSDGTYAWTAKVTLNGETYIAARGVFTVVPSAGAVETLHEEKVIAILEAALEGRLTADMEAFTIGGQQVQKIKATELEGMLRRYRWKLWHRQNPGRLGTPVAVEFSRVGSAPAAPEPVVLPWWYSGAR